MFYKGESGYVDHSKYAKEHQWVVDYVKHQLNIDLNKYRDGDGSSPFTTSYWEKTGPKVAIDFTKMSKNDLNAIRSLKSVIVEGGGGWFAYISKRKNKNQRSEYWY